MPATNEDMIARVSLEISSRVDKPQDSLKQSDASTIRSPSPSAAALAQQFVNSIQTPQKTPSQSDSHIETATVTSKMCIELCNKEEALTSDLCILRGTFLEDEPTTYIEFRYQNDFSEHSLFTMDRYWTLGNLIRNLRRAVEKREKISRRRIRTLDYNLEMHIQQHAERYYELERQLNVEERNIQHLKQTLEKHALESFGRRDKCYQYPRNVVFRIFPSSEKPTYRCNSSRISLTGTSSSGAGLKHTSTIVNLGRFSVDGSTDGSENEAIVGSGKFTESGRAAKRMKLPDSVSTAEEGRTTTASSSVPIPEIRPKSVPQTALHSSSFAGLGAGGPPSFTSINTRIRCAEELDETIGDLTRKNVSLVVQNHAL